MICELYKSTLSADEKCAYEALVAGYQAMKTSIVFDLADHHRLERLLDSVRYDHPEIFYVDGTFNYRVMNMFGKTRITLMPQYLYSQSEVARISAKCKAEAERIIKGAPSDDFGRELLVHDRLCEKIVYQEGAHAHSIIGALIDGRCVCEGISKAAKYCFDMLGMTTAIMTGNAGKGGDIGPHAWNVVKIRSDWYHVDITWDNGTADTMGCTTVSVYDYFNLCDEEIEVNHKIDMALPCRATETDENYYMKNDLYAFNMDMVKDIAQREIRAGKKVICFRCASWMAGKEESILQTVFSCIKTRRSVEYVHSNMVFSIKL
ncbi:MAG: hypothetical protein J6R42_04015 [Clostridia bacterium]|nr:hypothetical protein [Clostridia bacterium]